MLPPHTSARVTPPPHEHPPAVQSIMTAIAHGTPHLDPALEEREDRLDHSLRRRMGRARLKSDHLQLGQRRRWLGRLSTHISHPEGNPRAGGVSGWASGHEVPVSSDHTVVSRPGRFHSITLTPTFKSESPPAVQSQNRGQTMRTSRIMASPLCGYDCRLCLSLTRPGGPLGKRARVELQSCQCGTGEPFAHQHRWRRHTVKGF